jgi:hypothetical protein
MKSYYGFVVWGLALCGSTSGKYFDLVTYVINEKKPFICML